jgi:DNA gyrase subunit A
MPIVEPVNLEAEMKSAYMDYAMSVIVGRALPDVRDGLKPVHRRTLYGMHNMGLAPNRAYRKSAKIVGEIMGNYHPHGDLSIYDTLVRMAQDFNLRYPLVDGQGNYGSVDGDPPAAMRYTEARPTWIATELLESLDRETVDFVPTYDESQTEPTVLPSRVPNLLMNGSTGIAVGMATNIPPHNLGELIDGLTALLADPAMTIEALARIIQGPDFPTFGFIYGLQGIRDAYTTGRGIIMMRARAGVEVNERTEKEAIIISQLPYQVNKGRLLEKLGEIIRERQVEGISDMRDESDRDGMRIVIELKRGEIATVILNHLYKMTQLQTSFGVIMLALVSGRPEVLNLKQMLQHFLDFRREVVVRRARFDLRQAEARAHILEGLKIALDHLDAVIALIRASASPEEARTGLQRQFGLSEIQAAAILDMKLQRLTALEREKLLAEYRDILQKIEALKRLLASDDLIREQIRTELLEVRQKYADPRRTEIIPEAGEIVIEDLIAREEMAITVSHTGYIKRTALSVYRSQRRGGKGKLGAALKDEDFIEHLFTGSTHNVLLFFTDLGRVHWLKVYEIPEAGRATKGKAIVNLLQVSQEEKIAAILSIPRFEEGKYVVMATRQGLIKKTSLDAYSNPRAGGVRAINLEEGDKLISVRLTSGNDDILLGTKLGLSIRFHEEEARAMGRVATGVWGIRLREGDDVISMETLPEGVQTSILTVTENGYGKRTALSEYRKQGRGGQGVITIQATERNGNVVAALQVQEDEEVMLMTAGGKTVRLAARDIRVIGRNTQGVRLIEPGEGGRVVAVARLAEKQEEGAAEAEG